MSVRLLRKPTPGTAFVLGGGGNLGAVQIGMLQALSEAGVVPEVLIGCSVGALNAAGMAADPTPAGVRRLRDTWVNLDADELWPAGRISGLWMLGRKGQAIQPNTGLRRLIERTLPYKRLEDAVIPVHVNATSLETGRGHWFTTGPAVEAILASAALPAVFPPVVVGGEAYIDGGVVDNVPISRAVALGARRVYVLHVGNYQIRIPTDDTHTLHILYGFKKMRPEGQYGVHVGCHDERAAREAMKGGCGRAIRPRRAGRGGNAGMERSRCVEISAS